MFVPACDRPSVAEQTGQHRRHVMESEINNSQENTDTAAARSPLLDLPIRQLMGNAH